MTMYEKISIKLDFNILKTDFGAPLFGLNKPTTATELAVDKKDKVAKRKEITEKVTLMNALESSMETGVLVDARIRGNTLFTKGVSSIDLNLFTTDEKVNTFKFFGVDMTDNLDIVIPTSFGTILVFDTIDVIIAKATEKLYDHGFKSVDVEGFLSRDNIKSLIEKVKFGNFRTDSLKENFKEFSLKGVSSTRSLILSYIKKLEDSVKMPNDSEEDMANLMLESMVGTIREGVILYFPLKQFLSLYEEWFKILGDVVGSSKAVELFGRCVQGGGNANSVNMFQGVVKNNNILSGMEVKNVGKDYLAALRDDLYYIRDTHFEEALTSAGLSKDDIGISMSEFGPYVDYTEITSEDIQANNLLDYMKYKDEDLLFASYDYTEDNKAMIIKQAVKMARQKFRDISSTALDEAIIKISTDTSGNVNIINKKDTFGVDTMYIQSKNSLIKSTTLVEKLLKRSISLFK